MKKWAFLIGAAAAMGATAVIVTLALQRRREADDVPEIISDCFDRIQRLEAELHRLRPAAAVAG